MFQISKILDPYLYFLKFQFFFFRDSNCESIFSSYMIFISNRKSVNTILFLISDMIILPTVSSKTEFVKKFLILLNSIAVLFSIVFLKKLIFIVPSRFNKSISINFPFIISSMLLLL